MSNTSQRVRTLTYILPQSCTTICPNFYASRFFRPGVNFFQAFWVFDFARSKIFALRRNYIQLIFVIGLAFFPGIRNYYMSSNKGNPTSESKFYFLSKPSQLWTSFLRLNFCLGFLLLLLLLLLFLILLILTDRKIEPSKLQCHTVCVFGLSGQTLFSTLLLGQ